MHFEVFIKKVLKIFFLSKDRGERRCGKFYAKIILQLEKIIKGLNERTEI